MADIELLHAIGQLLDVKLQPVHERLDRMDERLDRVDERLDGIDKRLTNLEEQVVSIDKRLTNLEGQVVSIDKRLTNLEEQVSEVKGRVKCLELIMENEVKPRLHTIEECYLSTYKRYVEYSKKMKSAFGDIDILKKTVHRHSIQLQSAT